MCNGFYPVTLKRRRVCNLLSILTGDSPVELSLIQFLKKLGNEKTLCEVGQHEETNHVEGLLKTTNVPEHIQNRVHLPTVNLVPLVKPDVNRCYRSVVSTDLVIVASNV